MVSSERSSVSSSERLPHATRQLVMLGTSVNTKGGISSVVKLYVAAGVFRRWNAIYLPTHCDGSLLRKFATAMRALTKVLLLLMQGRDIVLHVHCASRASFWRKYVFIVAAVLARKPVIFHLHGAEFAQFYTSECGRIRQSMVRWLLNHCTRIIVLSNSWCKFISELTAVRVEVVPNPAMDLSATTTPTRSRSVLLFLGRLGQRKGIVTLLESMVKVLRKFPDVVLICGGDGDVGLVKNHAQTLGIASSVKLVGWVEAEEKLALLQSSTIFVLPSFAEGVPMSVLEAMSAGLPVVSTKVGGIPDVIATGVEGLLVAPGDVDALASALCSLLGSQELCDRFARNAHDRFKREFSLNSVICRLEAIYRELEVSARPAASET
jgi:glycosyltransferase involved in cell wall biosynthesis